MVGKQLKEMPRWMQIVLGAFVAAFFGWVGIALSWSRDKDVDMEKVLGEVRLNTEKISSMYTRQDRYEKYLGDFNSGQKEILKMLSDQNIQNALLQNDIKHITDGLKKLDVKVEELTKINKE